MDHKELRQIVTDFQVGMVDLQKKLEVVKKEMDIDREQAIKSVIDKVVNKTGSRLILDKYKISKKAVNSMLKTIKNEVDKFDLDSMGQVLSRVKKMSEYEKLQVAEYVLNELQVKSLKKQGTSQVFTGNLS